LTNPRFDSDICQAATGAQNKSADPAFSIFVEANAGSGKTRVLVDRVTRILLSDCPPDRILCVTYTKAAAAEMQQRLFSRLGKWSVMNDGELTGELAKLEPAGVSADQLPKARRLFARALETPGGLKIQTIHAFCENLLRRFPLEAGAPPGFQTLDDAATQIVVDRARRAVLSSGMDASIVAAQEAGGVEAVDNILKWARHNRYDFRRALIAGGDSDVLVDRLYQEFGIAADLDSKTVKAEAWSRVPIVNMEAAAHALLNEGSKNDKKRGACLDTALKTPDPASALDAYFAVFFNKNGTGGRASNLVTKTCAKAAPTLPDLMSAEADRLEDVREQLKIVVCAQASAAAIRLASAFLDAFDAELNRQRALDFDDLIGLAGDLLDEANPFSGWVSYKLDKTLSHALIDEAQDTAPRQWDMIRSLTREFFAGEGVSEEHRTLFAVGDEKQSIYSFQGADPARFLSEGDALESRSADAGMAFARPELDVSFRSSSEILQAVDQVFAGSVTPAAASAPETKFVASPGVQPFAHYHGHRAARADTPGCVEFWPAVPKPDIEEEGSIFDPVDAVRPGSSRDVLARTIAQHIKSMIERGDAVWEEDGGTFVQRPVKAGDIAILVWRRTGGFFEEVIRQLKIAGVPVAGADRMVLCEQTVVKDLLALARFGVTSGDDLALAEILKSPFFDPDDKSVSPIDDAALFDLSKTRKNNNRGALWAALFTSKDPRFQEARTALTDWRNKADTEGLYDLFTGFLNARSSTGETRWARVFARLGEEARDPAEEFLARAMQHERESGGALASFIRAIATDAMQLKREMGSGRDEVQVMTVHASKGLERPVIILPDTTRPPTGGRSEAFFKSETTGLLWSPRKDEDPDQVACLREAARQRILAEHGRLLYVALTRARDRLIVCGWRHGSGTPGTIAENSWYEQLKTAWSDADWQSWDSPLSDVLEDVGPGLRLGPIPRALGREFASAAADTQIPDWAHKPVVDEGQFRKPVAPSSLLADDDVEPGIFSPLSDPDGHRFRRGELIHKLLETLPDLPVERRRDAAERFVGPLHDLTPQTRQTLVDETLGILDHPEFAAIFGPGSRAEVGLVGHAEGLPAGVVVRGQVDRLVVTDHEVLIIDYKTNRPPPSDVSGVARVYLGQMGAYRALLRALHPEKTIRCALLWTDSACLMTLPDAAIDAVMT
jgi:ATP-dependent helicase/nuclease subunit A